MVTLINSKLRQVSGYEELSVSVESGFLRTKAVQSVVNNLCERVLVARAFVLEG